MNLFFRFLIFFFLIRPSALNASNEMTHKYDSTAEDTVIFVNPELPDFYGEIYHILMGMMASRELHAYIIGYSNKSDSQIPFGQNFAQKRLVSFLNFFGFEDRIYKQKTLSNEDPPFFEPIPELVESNSNHLMPAPVRTNFGHSTHYLVKSTLANSTNIKDLQIKIIETLNQKLKRNDQVTIHRFINEHFVLPLSNQKRGYVVWNRQSSYSASRNMSEDVLLELIQIQLLRGYHVFIMGHSLPAHFLRIKRLISQGLAIDITEHWNRRPFVDSTDTMALQLFLFAELQRLQIADGQIGMLGGVMDGPAVLLGFPTVELTTESIQKYPRMLQLQEAVETLSIWHLNRISPFKCASALAYKPMSLK